jgi:hypothetical protein
VEKLRASTAEDPRIVPDQSASRPSRPTAADILGLNRQRATGKQGVMSLEMELDQYLSDPNSGTGILEYWQVNLINSKESQFFSLIHITIFRNISIASLAFFVWQWISYQFRHQVSPVNESSHLESRQWHLEDHAFQLL